MCHYDTLEDIYPPMGRTVPVENRNAEYECASKPFIHGVKSRSVKQRRQDIGDKCPCDPDRRSQVGCDPVPCWRRNSLNPLL